MTLVHFPQAPDAHPSAHVPPVGAAVEAFFVHRDLAPNSRRVYRAALDPLVAAVGAGQPLAALTPDAVAGVFTDRWGSATGSGSSSSYRRHRTPGPTAARTCKQPPTGHAGGAPDPPTRAKPVRIYHVTVSLSEDLKNLLVIHHCPARNSALSRSSEEKGEVSSRGHSDLSGCLSPSSGSWRS